MTPKDPLRAAAEARSAPVPESLADLTPEEIRRTLHELRVHQIELEMQNEELRRSQQELDTARIRYGDLYDLAPVGYCTVAETGMLREANLMAASLLGVDRGKLIGRRFAGFISGEDADIFYHLSRQVMRTGDEQTCELRMQPRGGKAFWALLTASAATESAGKPALHIVLHNITGRKMRENIQLFLSQAGGGSGATPFFEALAGFLAKTLQMDFICIDRLEGEGLNARTLAVWCDGRIEDNVVYALKDTPCGDVVGRDVCCFPANVCQRFPHDEVLQNLRAECYAGVTLWGHSGQPIGSIAVIGRRPLQDQKIVEDTLKLVAVRAASELERKDVEADLRTKEEQSRTILQTAMDGFWMADTQGRILDANDSYCRMSGYDVRELLDMHISDIDVLESPDAVVARIQQIKEQNGVRFESRHRCKDGHLMDVEVCAKFLPEMGGRSMAFIRDITESNQSREQIASSLQEKESLLKEIHHRVKNNMQVISSLLSLQAGRLENPEASAALQNMQNRVRSMALIHENLYRTGNLAAVDMDTYLRSLCQQLLRASIADAPAINLQVDASAIRLEIDQAIPCGLLVNEMVSNALKHAFPPGGGGEVRVEIHAIPATPRLRLRVSDNGVGMPPEFELDQASSLGVKLVSDLARQLGGKLSIGTGPGAVFEVEFQAGE